MKKAKVLVIVGPNASGKSDLAVRLAKKFNGEIISADSRQVYKELNIGSGKATKKEMAGVRHHLLDVAGPKTRFSADDFKKLGEKALRLIEAQDKLPIIVGGTGFYIDALTGKVLLPDVPPNKLLRSKLNKLSKEKLFEMLKKQDPARAKTIDKYNKVRLVRALEIIQKLGRVPKITNNQQPTTNNFVYIGIKPNNLERRIKIRLLKRLLGIIRECRKLHKQGLSYKRMHELGLEYQFTAMYLKGKIDKKELVEKLNIAIRQYAKRQMTWFKRNRKIKWFTPSGVERFEPKNYKKIEKYVGRAMKESNPR